MTTTDRHPFGSEEWLTQAREELRERPCFRCEAIGVMTLNWEYRPTLIDGLDERVLIMAHPGCGLSGRITPHEDTDG